MNNIPIIPSSASNAQLYQSLLYGTSKSSSTQQAHPIILEKASTSDFTGQVRRADAVVPNSQKTNYEKSVGTLIDIQA